MVGRLERLSPFVCARVGSLDAPFTFLCDEVFALCPSPLTLCLSVCLFVCLISICCLFWRLAKGSNTLDAKDLLAPLLLEPPASPSLGSKTSFVSVLSLALSLVWFDLQSAFAIVVVQPLIE